MATAAITKPKTESFIHRAIALIPGLLLLAAVGYAGKFIELSINAYAKAHHTPFPDIEFVLWAIVIGLIIANTIGVPRIFEAGVATYEFWLKAGIVLLGSRFLLGDVLHLGGLSLLLVAIALTLSLTFMHLLGRAFKLKPKLTSLLAIGSAICGVSAIVAAKPSVDADDEDAYYAIAAFLWKKFPKFVLGFLLISLLAPIGFFTKPQLTSLTNLSRWALLLTFAGVGLRTNLRELGRQGWRPFAVGAIGEAFIALLTLGLVYGADRYLKL